LSYQLIFFIWMTLNLLGHSSDLNCPPHLKLVAPSATELVYVLLKRPLQASDDKRRECKEETCLKKNCSYRGKEWEHVSCTCLEHKSWRKRYRCVVSSGHGAHISVQQQQHDIKNPYKRHTTKGGSARSMNNTVLTRFLCWQCAPRAMVGRTMYT
jgi:hypothetical protein